MTSAINRTFNPGYVGEVYRTEQGLFCVDPADRFVARELIENGSYGTAQLAQIGMFCNEESSVLLLGAHLGALAVPLSKMVKNLTVFEANPRTFDLLSANLKLNDCANVEAFNLAANDKNEQLKFVMNTANSGGSKRFPAHQDHDYFYDEPDVVEVPSVRLDDVLQGRHYDVIFMDIEGSEYFAIKGMPKLMAGAAVVFAEFIPHHLSRVGGVSIDQFLSCFEGFETMIAPSMLKAFHFGDIRTALVDAFNKNLTDEGLIFVRRQFEVVFK